MRTTAAKISTGLGLLLTIGFVALALAADAPAVTVTHKGWFSDDKCAPSKVKSGKLGPNGRDCVQKCLKEGARMVFVDETAREMYFVDNPAVAAGQESHYVEVAGTIDTAKKTLRVASVKVLKEYVASCAVPKKGEPDQPNDSH